MTRTPVRPVANEVRGANLTTLQSVQWVLYPLDILETQGPAITCDSENKLMRRPPNPPDKRRVSATGDGLSGQTGLEGTLIHLSKPDQR